MKPVLYGSVTDNTHLNEIDFSCRVAIEPGAHYFYQLLIEDRMNYQKVILLHGLEPPQINFVSHLVIENQKLFDKIYSYDPVVLEKCENSEPFCFGSCWVLTDKFKKQTNKKIDYVDLFRTEDKKFKLSFVKSSKNDLTGHKLRHEVNFKDCKCEILYPTSWIDSKIPLFEDSMFHLAIENTRCKNYFTEKLIDCFISKTLPIYWGCPNISDYFNMDGILTFKDATEMHSIINNLTPEDYYNRLPIIQENYIRALEYAFFWDRLDGIIQTVKKI